MVPLVDNFLKNAENFLELPQFREFKLGIHFYRINQSGLLHKYNGEMICHFRDTFTRVICPSMPTPLKYAYSQNYDYC